MIKFNTTILDFSKMNGLIPAVIQDDSSKSVLMVGFMNEEAVNKTIENKKVTFWSRSKKRIWQKGEASGNYLIVKSISTDCDHDSLLIMATPVGPTCHKGEYSCFDGFEKKNVYFLNILFDLIKDRKEKLPENSYTTQLFNEGLSKILAKVKEESDEVINAAKNETTQRLIEESGDLLYHLLVLLAKKDIELKDVLNELEQRQ